VTLYIFKTSTSGNASYGTVEEAAEHGEVVLLAIPIWGIVQISSVLQETANGKVLIDAMNFFERRDGPIAEQLRTICYKTSRRSRIGEETGWPCLSPLTTKARRA